MIFHQDKSEAPSEVANKGRQYSLLGRALKVQSFDTLTRMPAIQALLARIRLNCRVNEGIFNDYFYPLLQKVVVFFQLMPLTSQASPGSLLLNALVRVDLALHHWSALPEAERNHNELHTFIIFSAALLFHADRIFQSFQVNCLDQEGELLRRWNPYRGPLEAFAQYYVMVPIYRQTDTVRTAILLSFAKQWMGADIFSALSDDRQLYYQWLALLTGEGEVVGALHAIKQLFFDKEALLLENEKHHADPPSFDELIDLDVDTLRDKWLKGVFDPLDGFESDKAQEFMRWLQNHLKDDAVMINDQDAHVHVLSDEGILVEPHILLDFLRSSPNSAGLMFLYKQMLAWMGIYLEDSTTSIKHQFRSYYAGEGSDGKLRSGLLIPAYFLPEVGDAVSHFKVLHQAASWQWVEQAQQKADYSGVAG